MAEDLNLGRPRTNPASGQSETARLRVRRADISVSLPPKGNLKFPALCFYLGNKDMTGNHQYWFHT